MDWEAARRVVRPDRRLLISHAGHSMALKLRQPRRPDSGSLVSCLVSPWASEPVVYAARECRLRPAVLLRQPTWPFGHAFSCRGLGVGSARRTSTTILVSHSAHK